MGLQPPSSMALQLHWFAHMLTQLETQHSRSNFQKLGQLERLQSCKGSSPSRVHAFYICQTESWRPDRQDHDCQTGYSIYQLRTPRCKQRSRVSVRYGASLDSPNTLKHNTLRVFYVQFEKYLRRLLVKTSNRKLSYNNKSSKRQAAQTYRMLR